MTELSVLQMSLGGREASAVDANLDKCHAAFQPNIDNKMDLKLEDRVSIW